MSFRSDFHFKKWFIATAAIMIFITAAAVSLNLLSAEYLVLYNYETNARYVTVKADDGMMFSVEFIHSVNQTPLKDTYIIDDGQIRAHSTTYRSFGAGVQTALNEGEKMTYDDEGNMVITGIDKTFDPLIYIVGTVSDHILELNGKEISLRNLCGRNARVVFDVAPLYEILTKGMFD